MSSHHVVFSVELRFESLLSTLFSVASMSLAGLIYLYNHFHILVPSLVFDKVTLISFSMLIFSFDLSCFGVSFGLGARSVGVVICCDREEGTASVSVEICADGK